METSLLINGQTYPVSADENTPLLYVIRDEIGLLGTKFGCGKAACGACTIIMDGSAVRSCSVTLQDAANKSIITIEGLSSDGKTHPVQQAWINQIVPQCGYCQPGFMMATAALLQNNPNPTDEEINAAISNICRCGTYYRMKKAIKEAIQLNQNPLQTGVEAPITDEINEN